MVVELMFLPIMARATHVQSKRMQLPYVFLQSGCAVKHTPTHTYTHIHTHTHTQSKPFVYGLRNWNTVYFP